MKSLLLLLLLPCAMVCVSSHAEAEREPFVDNAMLQQMIQEAMSGTASRTKSKDPNRASLGFDSNSDPNQWDVSNVIHDTIPKRNKRDDNIVSQTVTSIPQDKQEDGEPRPPITITHTTRAQDTNTNTNSNITVTPNNTPRSLQIYDEEFLIDNLRVTIYCISGNGFDKDARVVWIGVKNNWIVDFFVDRGIMYTLYVTTIIDRYTLINGQQDLQIDYEMEIQFVRDSYDDDFVTYSPMGIASKPWSTEPLRFDFLDELASKPRTKSFDKTCGMSEITCVGPCQTLSPTISQAPSDPKPTKYPSRSPVARPTRSPVLPLSSWPTPTIDDGNGNGNGNGNNGNNNGNGGRPNSGSYERETERYLFFSVYGMTMGDALAQPDDTPPMWNQVGSWQSEHSTFNTGHYPRNNTVWDVRTTTRLVAAANDKTFDLFTLNSIYDTRRELLVGDTDGETRALQFSPVLTQKTDPCRETRALQFSPILTGRSDPPTSAPVSAPTTRSPTTGCPTAEPEPIFAAPDQNGLFLIYRQKFQYSSMNNLKPKADDLSSTPMLYQAQRESYKRRLQSTISSQISGMSRLGVGTPGYDYAYNVEDLVIAIGPPVGLGDLQRQKFELSVDRHLVQYWTGLRKWAAIFDLEVISTTIDSEFLREFLYIEYQVHFRYRSMYHEEFLEKHRVALEPLETDEGKEAFIEGLGYQYEDHEVLYTGTLEGWKASRWNSNLVDTFNLDNGNGDNETSTVIYWALPLGVLMAFGAIGLLVYFSERRRRTREAYIDEDSLGEVHYHESEYLEDEEELYLTNEAHAANGYEDDIYPIKGGERVNRESDSQTEDNTERDDDSYAENDTFDDEFTYNTGTLKDDRTSGRDSLGSSRDGTTITNDTDGLMGLFRGLGNKKKLMNKRLSNSSKDSSSSKNSNSSRKSSSSKQSQSSKNSRTSASSKQSTTSILRSPGGRKSTDGSDAGSANSNANANANHRSKTSQMSIQDYDTRGSMASSANTSVSRDGSPKNAPDMLTDGGYDPNQVGPGGGYDPSQPGGPGGGYDPNQPSGPGGPGGGYDPNQPGGPGGPGGYDPNTQGGPSSGVVQEDYPSYDPNQQGGEAGYSSTDNWDTSNQWSGSDERPNINPQHTFENDGPQSQGGPGNGGPQDGGQWDNPQQQPQPYDAQSQGGHSGWDRSGY